MADITKTSYKGLGLPKHFDPSMEQMKKNMEVIDDILQKAVPNDLTSITDANAESNINVLTKTGRYLVKADATGYPPVYGGFAGVVDVFRAGTFILQEWRSINSPNHTCRRYSTNTGSSWGGWIKDWNANNDGSGSGLDADLLDGLHSSSFFRVQDTTSNFNLATSEGKWRINGATNAPYNGCTDWVCIVYHLSNTTNELYQIAYEECNKVPTGISGGSTSSYSNMPLMFIRKRIDSTTWSSWQTVWHSGIDGSGSGLNADLLDGYHASSFVLASNLLSAIKDVDGTGSGLDADLLDGQHEYQMAKYGDVSGTLPTTGDPTSTSTGGCQMFRFKDSSNLIGEGANKYYGIIQIYYSSSYYIRIAVSITSGKVYRQTSSHTAWSEITPLIPVLSTDPSSPSEGQMWILSE